MHATVAASRLRALAASRCGAAGRRRHPVPRALSHGNLDPLTDAWWVGGAIPTHAAATLEADGIGPVTDRATVAQESVDGPLRAAQRAAAALLVIAALVLTLVGIALHSTTALQAREVDVARLRGLGASRRSVRASVLAEQAVLTGSRSSPAACWAASRAGRRPPCWRCPPRGSLLCRPPRELGLAGPGGDDPAALLGCAAVIVPLASARCAARRSRVCGWTGRHEGAWRVARADLWPLVVTMLSWHSRSRSPSRCPCWLDRPGGHRRPGGRR